MTLASRIVKCLRCGHEWIPRLSSPKRCPECNSPYWNRMRTRMPTVMKIPKRD